MQSSIPRLLIGNFDFEHTLASGSGAQPPAALRRIVAELAAVWIVAAADGDVLWCPQPIDPTFFEDLQAQGLPRVYAVSRSADVPTGLELVPWGWTDDVIRWGTSVGAIIDAPPLEAVRMVNSRRFSHQLECEWGVGIQSATIADTLSGLFEAIDRLPHSDAGWVVKSEFSNASRERFLHRGDHPVDRNALSRWAKRRLSVGQSLFVESWVDRVDEVGVQLAVPRNGTPRVEGLTRLLVDDAGHYRGSEFSPRLDADPHWQDAVTTALDVARAVQQTGYFGPLGIDAMHYHNAAGDLRLRPIQDINARWTMGRLSLGLRRLLRPDERGYWLHGPGRAHVHQAEAKTEPRIREIVTTPGVVGKRPVRLSSAIRIVDRS
jgi:hypothetical protein